MNIGFVGVGKLGMPCALAIDMAGHEVYCHDVNPDNMQKESFKHREIGPNGEESIEPLLRNSNLKFSSLRDLVKKTDIIFVAVQTPHGPEYEGVTRIPEKRMDFEYKYLVDCIRNISNEVDKIQEDKIVIIISTVLPGTVRKNIIPIMSERIKLCYNPFFIAMGTTMQDFLNPEFVLFGVHDEEAARTAEDFYKTLHDRPFYKTSIENAEAIKVFYNTFISTKISIANTIMEMSHKLPGCNCDDIMTALKMAKDRLVSEKYLNGGMGDGGGCHPRDNIALSWLSKELDMSFDWFEAAMMQRENQTEWLADLIIDIKEKNNDLDIVILGKSFKNETNLTVGSPSILLKNILEEKKQDVKISDPHTDCSCVEDFELLGPSIYFIGTKHDIFRKYKYPEGSIVIDPFRYIPDQEGVKVIPIGIGKN